VPESDFDAGHLQHLHAKIVLPQQHHQELSARSAALYYNHKYSIIYSDNRISFGVRRGMMRPAIAALGLLLSTSLASAADLVGPYDTYGGSLKDEPIVVAPFSWTGFYIGANVGYGWADADADPFPPGTPGLPFGLNPDSEPEGWFGGGQIGYSLQSGSVVLGIEVD